MRVRRLNGYRVIYQPDHPAAMQSDNWKGFVYEHIVVAEEFLQRRLKNEEVCHHLDGNHSNNRKENIIVLLRSQHAKLHAWLNSGAPGVESSRLKRVNSGKSKVGREHDTDCCLTCGRALKKTQIKYCSNKCRARKRRKVKWPTKRKLTEDLSKMSYCAVGRKYGVSDNTVRKWAKKHRLL